MSEEVSCISENIEEPFEVKFSNELGRYLVALRDIEEGEVIISERAFLSAPSDSGAICDEEYNLRCLGCCIDISEDNTFRRCTNCYFPCCSIECEQSKIHADNECQLFVENHAKYPPPFKRPILNKSIMILRALILKTKEPAAWTKLNKMESHIELRKNKPNCISSDEKILENIQSYYPSSKIDPDEVVRLSGIIDVNAHVLPQRVNARGDLAGICHIFLKTSLFSHSCSPNASWTICPNSDMTLVTRASVKILKGQEICVSYDVGEILYGTLRRLIPMEISGLFICKCKRCLDPTEFGTHLSTLICQNCHQGHKLPLSPTDSFSDWECQTCSHRSTDEDILELIEQLEYDIGFPKFNLLFSAKEESLNNLQEFVKKYSGIILHPNHYILQEVNIRIISVQSNELINNDSLTKNDLLEYIRKCRDLLHLFTIILPGTSEYKAIIQFHLCQGLFKLAKSDFENQIELNNEINQLRNEALIYFTQNYGYQKFINQLNRISL